ncbi:MAG: cell wall-binding repeat-containing protein, partial [Lachnospiraceae bacterium]|nr:cell wall-binding repeat-containing protein [Candidatus Equihabitans merdae]
ALGGSYLAAVKEAPMLLVDAGDIMLTANYVINNSNGGATVYILGGPAAVPSSIENVLASAGMNVRRLAGNTRYETNIKVLDGAGVDGQDTLLVVNGNNYADSLAASSTGAPILMVDGPASALMTEQRDWLPNHEFNEFVVLGGQGAVSSGIEGELTNSYAGGDANRVCRLAGGTRCETSTLVADYFFGDTHEVTFAYAWDFPDGLSGGPVANAVHAPVILVADSPDDLNVVGQYIHSKTLDHVYVMGGTARLSDAVITGLVG